MNASDSKHVFTASATVLWLIAGFLVLAAGVWLQGLGAASLWFDEAWSAHAAAQPTLIAAFNADATNPPLYYGLVHITARLWGDSEFGLRATSWLLGLVACALAIRLARRAGGSRAAVLAAALLALAPLLGWAAQEARMYTLLAVGVMACALAWEQVRTRPSAGAWALLLGAELALLYAHNTGPVLALWLNAATLLTWLARRDGRPGWRPWLIGQSVVAALWAPYFFSRFVTLSAANGSGLSVEGVGRGLASLALLPDRWLSLWRAPWAADDPQAGVLVAAAGLGALWLLLAVRGRRARWLAAHTLIIAAGLELALALLGTDLHPRYLVMAVPLALAALAAGLARAPLFVQAAGLICAAGLALAAPPSTAGLPKNDDARAMVSYYAATLGADDTVLAWSYADRYDLAYYWDRLGVAARRVTLPEGAGYEAIAPLIPASGRVALNIWYTQRADFRGMMGCALEHGATAAPIAHTTAGMTTLVYGQPPAPLPLKAPWAAAFAPPAEAGAAVATLIGVGVAPAWAADQALCLPIALRLDQAPLAGNLFARLSLRHPIGGEVVAVDAPFATADQRLTGRMAPAEIATAYPLLRLPAGAPAGPYDLFLRVYAAGEWQSGLEPPRDAGALVSGRDLAIGVWQAAAGTWAPSTSATDPALTFAAGALRLVERDFAPAAGEVVRAGDPVRAMLLWSGEGTPPPVELADSQGRWRLLSDAPGGEAAGLLRQWHRLTVPADAPAGEARLMADGREIARWPVLASDYVAEAPPLPIALDGGFPGIGALIGADLPAAAQFGTPIAVDLAWRASQTPTVSYTVFVQAIDADGRVAAQSDRLPAGGARPTTGWRAGEAIADRHELAWTQPPAPGPLTVIAGLYDASTGARVLLASGADHVVIGAMALAGG